jgi:hypothetical protein
MDDNEDDDCCNGVDEDDAQASKIQADAWWIPFSEFPSRSLSEVRFGGRLVSL